MSQSRTPPVHNVIPLFDIITHALDDNISDTTLPSAIRMAAWRGRAMLNKYYGLTDDSIIYQIAMCMCILYSAFIPKLTFMLLKYSTPAINLCTFTKQDGHILGLRLQKTYCVPSGT
jgi:hypothetical protein